MEASSQVALSPTRRCPLCGGEVLEDGAALEDVHADEAGGVGGVGGVDGGGGAVVEEDLEAGAGGDDLEVVGAAGGDGGGGGGDVVAGAPQLDQAGGVDVGGVVLRGVG